MSFGGRTKTVVQEVKVPEPLPPAPERTATETAALAEEQRRRFATGRSGRASTILTGGTGGAGGVSALRFLGGAART